MNQNESDPSEAPSYHEYLKVPELLSLQERLSSPPHHDEMLFIIIHQSYELWFKLLLHELENAIFFMRKVKVLRARHFLDRANRVLQTLVQQIHILESMSPVEFLGFRDRLNPASGFQSFQFRELEFISGLKDPKFLKVFEKDSGLKQRLESRLDQPDLPSAFHMMLDELGFKNHGEKEKVMPALKEIYENPEDFFHAYLLAESLIEYDENLILFRTHHVSVVERVIGMKQGTGGSSGVAYLKGTLDRKCVPWLWEVRTNIEKKPTV